MELRHIPLEDLKLTKVNVRHGKTAPDVSDILPSIRKRGIFQPLLVRPNGKGFEVVAGRRRFFAASTVAEETGQVDPLPCAIMAKGDDAAAIEASLLENTARLPMDPMNRYEAFARLLKEGREIDEIAETFGITERMVKRVLALANLIAPIRNAYRRDEIDHATLRILTMASKAQQKEWMKLLRSKDAHAPTGHQLKRWLFGGDNIATSAALFDLEDYTGSIITDLFGEDDYFADADAFWTAQEQAIEDKKTALIEDGWASVEVLERGANFSEWEYEKASKKDGGRVFIAVRHNGAVTFHEGYISRAEARARERKAAGQDGASPAADKPDKPEITKAMQTYIELHRHQLVRAELLSHPSVALRLSVAHMIAGSGLWTIRPEPQKAPKPEIAATVHGTPLQEAFDKERREVFALLELPEDRSEVVRHNGDTYPAAVLFARLLALSDAEVMRIMAFAMAETLQSGSCLVEAAGVHLDADATGNWQADDVFLDLLKDKRAINAALADIAGDDIAEANVKCTGKVQKGIVADFLKGENGRRRVKDWVPNWLKFPFRSHTDTPIETTGIGSEWRRIADRFQSPDDAAA